MYTAHSEPHETIELSSIQMHLPKRRIRLASATPSPSQATNMLLHPLCPTFEYILSQQSRGGYYLLDMLLHIAPLDKSHIQSSTMISIHTPCIPATELPLSVLVPLHHLTLPFAFSSKLPASFPKEPASLTQLAAPYAQSTLHAVATQEKSKVSIRHPVMMRKTP
jgi:hypothetical protein